MSGARITCMCRCASSYLSAAICGFARDADEQKTSAFVVRHLARARAPGGAAAIANAHGMYLSGREVRRRGDCMTARTVVHGSAGVKTCQPE
jgi:hypothetical protein